MNDNIYTGDIAAPDAAPITVAVTNGGGKTKLVRPGTTLLHIAKSFGHTLHRPILLAKVDGELQDLRYRLFYDCQVTFLDISDSNGFRAYQRSASYLMIRAAKAVLGKQTRVVIEHSINKNYYCEFPEMDDLNGNEIADALLEEISAKMTEYVEEAAPIEKCVVPLEAALRLSEEWGLTDKIGLLKYRRVSNVSLYRMGDFYDYFYGNMLPGAGYIKSFRLSARGRGFVLQFPSADNDYEIAEMRPNDKVFDVMRESNDWARILNAETVGSLNDIVCRGGFQELMLVNEALHEKKLANLADTILREDKSIVLIAGPSSSSKTTFAYRLCVQLRVNGMRPHVISLDDYFLDRADTPKDKDGNYDFECLGALDVEQLNKDLSALLAGEEVDMPSFNFLLGRRERNGRKLRLEPSDVLVIEGIHGLNEKLTRDIPRPKKYKIFISALTQVNVDDHNRISTTDTRLVRRIVRDYQFRGASAQRTIAMWPSVLRGEDANIFPFQEDADAFFNSALVYEMCVLKQFAEPLLFSVGKDEPEYAEARRLIKFLDMFLGVSSEQVPPNSLLREFVGGGCFKV
ncbi:MAG: nucleoside kinase [Defluviitaleaceae bacterium]|nr:nucleoside kinase [Defluviitaleaceae bacterium]